jgi:hypothetical protein
VSTYELEGEPTPAELQLLLRAALLEASPQEHGRARARQALGRLTGGLLMTAAAVAAYDLTLVAGL